MKNCAMNCAMKRKKLLAVALLLAAMTVFLTGCGMSASAQELYEHAHFCLGAGEYAAAQTYFAQLGEYLDAADCALYAGALQAWQDGDTDLARRTLKSLHPFKSSGRYLTYLDAMDAEKEGDLQEAFTLYESLGTFGDSAEAARGLRTRLLRQEALDDQESPDDQESLDAPEELTDSEEYPDPTEESAELPSDGPILTEAPTSEPSPMPVSVMDAMRAPRQTPAAEEP